MAAFLLSCLLGLTLQQAQACAAPAAQDDPGCRWTWFEGGYNQALSVSRDEGRPTLVAFLPAWSDYSRALREEVLGDPALCPLLAGLTCLDVQGDTPRGSQVESLHGITSYPVLLVLTADGRAEDRIDGFIPAPMLVGELNRILAGVGTVSALRAQADAAPDDLALRAALAGKLGAIGQQREATRLLESIRREDPQGATLAGARVLIQDALDETVARAGAEGPSAYDLSLLRSVADGVAHGRARFEGLARLADLARLAGRDDQVLPSWRDAWAAIPADARLDWGLDLADMLRERTETLDQDGLDFYLDVARSVADGATQRQASAEASAPDGTALAPWVARRLDALAFAHWARGDLDEALALAERCVALDPDNPEYGGRSALFLAER